MPFSNGKLRPMVAEIALPDMYVLTLIAAVAAVAAVIVPIYQRWDSQRRKWHIKFVDVQPSGKFLSKNTPLQIVFRNDGEPDINIKKGPLVIIEERHIALLEPLRLGWQTIFGPDGDPTKSRLRTDDEKVYSIGKNQLADDLRMQNCWDKCRIRAVFYDTGNREYRSGPFVVPVEQWLDPDASARTQNPPPAT